MTLPDVLRQIVERRRERFGVATDGPLKVGDRKPSGGSPRTDLSAETRRPPSTARSGPVGGSGVNPFLAALRAPAPGRRRIVAEIKMGSPRIGSLAGRVDPLAQARLYAEGGAAALSVVVEPDHFHGSWELLAACREVSGLPAIAKDFVVHPRQLELARAAGADAVLLIAALYSAPELAAWAGRARALGLVPLVETHDEGDLAKLAAAAEEGGRWELVGINNRDLRTFEVDVERSARLAARLPAGAIRVAESGISSAADVDRLAAAGFDAFLVGEALLLADDPAAKLAELVSTAGGELSATGGEPSAAGGESTSSRGSAATEGSHGSAKEGG